MKSYPYKAGIFSKTTTQVAEATGQTYKVENQGSKVPPHEAEIQGYVDMELVADNGALAPYGIRFRLDTSLDGTDWLPVTILHELEQVGTYQGLKMADQELLGLVRVVAVPYSANDNLPTWRGTVHLISDAPISAVVVRAS